MLVAVGAPIDAFATAAPPNRPQSKNAVRMDVVFKDLIGDSLQ